MGGKTILLGPGRGGAGGPEIVDAGVDVSSLKSFWELEAPLQGNMVSMEHFGRAKATLVVNIASG